MEVTVQLQFILLTKAQDATCKGTEDSFEACMAYLYRREECM